MSNRFLLGSALTAALVLAGLPASAQAPHLVKDIWPGPSSSQPGALVPVGDRVFFAAYTPELGIELWSSGGTNASTTFVDAAGGLILDDDGVASAQPVELSHGTAIRADLVPPSGPGPDRDQYVLLQAPAASYELVVDEASGDAAPLTVQRMAADGTTVLQSAVPVGTGTALSLRWLNSTFDAVADQQVRIESASCGTVCGADDTYRVRFYETTLRGARVNNTNGQVTVVLLQNLTDAPVLGFFYLLAEDGVNGVGGGYTIPPRGMFVLDTSQNLFVPGSVTVTHDAPYGAVAGKVVALDPATGFGFDTPLTSRPR